MAFRSIRVPAIMMGLSLLFTACDPKEEKEEHHHHEQHNIVAITPLVKDVVLTQEYVCQIRSQNHIEIRTLEMGYLEEIQIKEGQTIKKGDVLFTIVPLIYKAKYESEVAEMRLAQLELNNTRKLFEDKVVSDREVSLYEAKLAKAQARAKIAESELNFTTIRAPFNGIVDRLMKQTGSLVQEGEVLTTLSDNSTMWVYFNVPEVRYLEYMNRKNRSDETQQVQLKLANTQIYPHDGKISAIEADFNNETGNISFRADFPNPEKLLRNGQTGNVLLNTKAANQILVPQRATFEILDKRYVFVIDEHNVVHQREISIQNELDDVFIIRSGVRADDKIILEGVRQVRDGDHVEYKFQPLTNDILNKKYHAE